MAIRDEGVGMGWSKEGPGSEVHGGCVPVVSQEAPAPPLRKPQSRSRRQLSPPAKEGPADGRMPTPR